MSEEEVTPVEEATPEVTMESILAEPGINPEPVTPEPTPPSQEATPSQVDVSGLVNDLQELRSFKEQYYQDQVKKEVGTAVSKIKELTRS